MTNQEYAQDLLVRIGEKLGPSTVPAKERSDWSLTGFRHILEVEKELERRLTDKEWYDMSIR